MTNGEYFMFLLGFLASAGMFYNIGVIRTQRKYMDEVLDLSARFERLVAIGRMERMQ